MCRVLKHFVKDKYSKDQWVECPECHGYNSDKCTSCKGSGVRRKKHRGGN